MSIENDGGSAFPWGEHGTHLGGMTLRDYFAAHAPAVPDDFAWIGGETDLFHRIFRWNYFYADGMLKAREA